MRPSWVNLTLTFLIYSKGLNKILTCLVYVHTYVPDLGPSDNGYVVACPCVRSKYGNCVWSRALSTLWILQNVRHTVWTSEIISKPKAQKHRDSQSTPIEPAHKVVNRPLNVSTTSTPFERSLSPVGLYFCNQFFIFDHARLFLVWSTINHLNCMLIACCIFNFVTDLSYFHPCIYSVIHSQINS